MGIIFNFDELCKQHLKQKSTPLTETIQILSATQIHLILYFFVSYFIILKES